MFNGNFNLRNYLIRILVLFLSISVHEWAHAYSAFRYGDDTAALQGRLTLNPMRHFDPIGLMFILLGAPIAWAKPVPVNSGRFHPHVNRKKAILVVSLSGIVMNLVLAFFGAGGFYFTSFLSIKGIDGNVARTVVGVFADISLYLLTVNVYLAIFNLLPIPQLDGFELFSRLMPNKWVWWLQSNSRVISMVMLGLIIFFRGPFGRFLQLIAVPVISVLEIPWKLLFNLILR